MSDRRYQMIERQELPQGQVVLFEQYRLFRRTWWWVILAALIMAGVTWFYVSNYVDPEYTATATAVPPRKQGTPLDNLLGDISSGLKGAGISKLLGRSSTASGYTDLGILSSRAVLDSIMRQYDLYDVYEIPRNRPDLMYGELAGRLNIEIDEEGPIEISMLDKDPDRAASIANDVVRVTNNLLVDLNRRETEPITEFLEERYTELKARQGELARRMENYIRENNIVDPEGQLPVAAAALMEARAQESAARAMMNVLESSLGEEDPAVQQQREILTEAISERQRLERGSAGVSPGLGQLPQAMVDYLRIRQDYEVNAATLALLEPIYEQTRFDEERDIPGLLMLHAAFPPPVKSTPRTGLIVFSAFVGALFLATIVLSIMAYFRSFQARYSRYVIAYDRGAPRLDAEGE